MGCGVPVLGYDNAMWAQMRADCGAGWLVPMARWSALADEVARLAVAREDFRPADLDPLLLPHLHIQHVARARHEGGGVLRGQRERAGVTDLGFAQVEN